MLLSRPTSLGLALLAVLATLALSPGDVHAQKVGFVIGRSISDVITSYGPYGDSYQERRALTAGVSYRRSLGSGFTVQPELLVVPKGWGPNAQPTLRLTYLEMPVLVRLGAVKDRGWPVRPVLAFGGSASWLLNCDLSGLGRTTTAGSGCRTRIVAPFEEDYSIRRYDASAMLGLGLEVRVAGAIVGLDGRYDYGLVDIRPRKKGHTRNGAFLVLFHFVPKQGPREGGPGTQ